MILSSDFFQIMKTRNISNTFKMPCTKTDRNTHALLDCVGDIRDEDISAKPKSPDIRDGQDIILSDLTHISFSFSIPLKSKGI